MKYTGERPGSRKIWIVQSFKQLIWVMHRPELIEHMLSDAFENILDLAGIRKIFLIVDSGKLPKKRGCLVRYTPQGRRHDKRGDLRSVQRHARALAGS